jgi:alpha-L-fucosidase
MKIARVMLSVAVLISMSGVCLGAEEAKPMKGQRTTWFKNAKWGVFTHYMADTVLQDATVETWNEAVNNFDVQGLAEQLKAAGAGYYIITLGQNSGFYCSPNATYDKYAGTSPSKCSTRDLIADLYEALHPRGIALMVYLPSGAPDRDATAVAALEWKPGKHPRWDKTPVPAGEEDSRLESFQRKWEDVIREWSTRWGTKVAGWWFDGCYFPDAMYRHPNPPNFESFAAAARAGNPNSIVAFNPGVVDPIISLTPFEDYTAGEINEPEKVKCPGRFVDGAQYHTLSYLGPQWAQSPSRFTDKQVAKITKGITRKGGVVSWDVPIQATGLISEPFLEQLAALGTAMRKAATGGMTGEHGAAASAAGKSYSFGRTTEDGLARGAVQGARGPRTERIENRISPQQRPRKPNAPGGAQRY